MKLAVLGLIGENLKDSTAIVALFWAKELTEKNNVKKITESSLIIFITSFLMLSVIKLKRGPLPSF
jgi:ABC-type sulfate transport system permease component